MPETSEALLNLINASGFLFQLRVEQEIKNMQALQLGNWKIIREHRWVDPIDGTEGFIDLILEWDIHRMVIECKRVTDATWIFLIPDERVSMRRARLLWSMLAQSTGKIAEWHDFRLIPESPEAEFCIVRGQGDRDTPMLERVSSLLLRSTESLANEELNHQTEAQREHLVYYSVVVTNATLRICRFNPSLVNISTGRLEANAADFKEVPFVRFRKNLSSALVGHRSFSDLQKANSENERTVFVINSGQLANTIREWRIPYDQNAPWPWEEINR